MMIDHDFIMEGDESLLDDLTVIGGSRTSTAYGDHLAAEFATGLAAGGRTIGVEMTAGIASAAARALMAAGHPFVVCLASGLDTPQRPHLAPLRDRAALVVTPHEDDRPYSRKRAQESRQLLAHLAHRVVIIEARREGSDLDLAWAAIHSGTMLYATPGPLTSLESEGSNDLIVTGDAQAITTPGMLMLGMRERSTP